MAADLTASLVLALLVFSFSVYAGQINITAKPGETDNLPCRAPKNEDVTGVEWRRPDLKSDQPVLLYRDSQLDPALQSPSFKNRVDLLDVNNGDLSLVLKNVKTNDTGIYECRVFQRGNNRRKRSLLGGDPICVVNLRVEPEGCEGAGNKEGKQRNKRAAPNTDRNCNLNLRVEPGNMEKQKMDGGNKNEPKEDGRNWTGLIVGLPVFAVVALLVAAVLYKRSRGSSQKSNPPPAAADVEETLTGPDE